MGSVRMQDQSKWHFRLEHFRRACVAGGRRLWVWPETCSVSGSSDASIEMERFPCEIGARLMELGELSRPLREAQAKHLARQLAMSVMLDLLAERDAHGTLAAYKQRIKGEVKRRSLARHQSDRLPSRTTWSDLLPEIPAAR
jgi:hypothetical protein